MPHPKMNLPVLKSNPAGPGTSQDFALSYFVHDAFTYVEDVNKGLPTRESRADAIGRNARPQIVQQLACQLVGEHGAFQQRDSFVELSKTDKHK